MLRKIVAVAVLLLALTTWAGAQDGALERAKALGWEFELRAGVNIGGDTPIPFPREIRSIEDYSPQFNGQIEALVTKWLDADAPLGLSLGLRLEQKGMQTSARVKNYFTSIEHEGTLVRGVWSGLVASKSSSISVTLPILASYRFNQAGKVSGGLFFGYRFTSDFAGHVSDGQFRLGDPTGECILFSADQRASYDFSDALNPYEMGLQVGGTWRAYRHFSVFADLKYSFTPLFKSHFEAISFKMYPLYLSAGFSYLF